MLLNEIAWPTNTCIYLRTELHLQDNIIPVGFQYLLFIYSSIFWNFKLQTPVMSWLINYIWGKRNKVPYNFGQTIKKIFSWYCQTFLLDDRKMETHITFSSEIKARGDVRLVNHFSSVKAQILQFSCTERENRSATQMHNCILTTLYHLHI